MAKVTTVYDGNKIVVNFLNVPAVLGEKIPIRLAGISTPSSSKSKNWLEQEKAAFVKRHILKLVKSAKKPGIVKLANLKREECLFGYVADMVVESESGGTYDVSDQLVENAMAVRIEDYADWSVPADALWYKIAEYHYLRQMGIVHN